MKLLSEKTTEDGAASEWKGTTNKQKFFMVSRKQTTHVRRVPSVLLVYFSLRHRRWIQRKNKWMTRQFLADVSIKETRHYRNGHQCSRAWDFSSLSHQMIPRLLRSISFYLEEDVKDREQKNRYASSIQRWNISRAGGWRQVADGITIRKSSLLVSLIFYLINCETFEQEYNLQLAVQCWSTRCFFLWVSSLISCSVVTAGTLFLRFSKNRRVKVVMHDTEYATEQDRTHLQ